MNSIVADVIFKGCNELGWVLNLVAWGPALVDTIPSTVDQNRKQDILSIL